ncbi:peptidoglycan DD-metalloendopeptidase family protein [Piscinibacter koreensis]|uniref:Peptidoglycan DD-metalloendopeptidase family protein n=1 Tax=Piscinibacter koreensis TaxID=2742824 RepID=A0A7Y6NRU7_9BURK|nr:peptidoglycan DD-metalloendopeptidase family protein [Schlegelella koreensis]NUZ08032.1 peptidoglycan DD-metalloendopeptidase family protein [Schlegelella koreensis]
MRGTAAIIAALLVSACSTPRTPAPVETRPPPPRPTRAGAATTPSTPVAAPAVDPATLPGAENAGKPGYYSVKPGDTLMRIATQSGNNWRDLVRWNNLENPNVIEVGQVLRVVPPGVEPGVATSRGVTAANIETRPLDARAPASTSSTTATTLPPVGRAGSAPAAAASSAATATPNPVGAASSPASGAQTATPPPTLPADDEEIAWSWPTSSSPAPYNEAKAKGLVFPGKAGDAVLAAADGRVVYAGSGLRGYGNLVIIKHNSTYLTAYAHNRSLLVKEDQMVRRGQKIAEMGSTDADSVQLHFEIRKQGKPVDPSRLLPPR